MIEDGIGGCFAEDLLDVGMVTSSWKVSNCLVMGSGCMEGDVSRPKRVAICSNADSVVDEGLDGSKDGF